MNAASARRGCLVLASHTGWGLADLMDLEDAELTAWLEALAAAKPE